MCGMGRGSQAPDGGTRYRRYLAVGYRGGFNRRYGFGRTRRWAFSATVSIRRKLHIAVRGGPLYET